MGAQLLRRAPLLAVAAYVAQALVGMTVAAGPIIAEGAPEVAAAWSWLF